MNATTPPQSPALDKHPTSGDELTAAHRSHFISDIIDADLAEGMPASSVLTRFPPEPNGFLHIGHAKSICLNFGLGQRYGGGCILRFDDTNPTNEDVQYVDSIQQDVRWLGFEWRGETRFASDYFERMYDYARRLIKAGKAYVCSLSRDEIRERRGSFEIVGTNSPYRERSIDENLDLFARMRAGEFEDGTHVLRAKIDMSHPNMIMRDPLLYRIKRAHHHRTGDAWCIYPMYDFAHCLEDAIEGITHSICTLEFESNRELYDWVLDAGEWDPRPHQYEFARLNLGYTVMSKRKLLQLVQEKKVSGWDDPRMPTIAGLRRAGVTPDAIRAFADMVGVAKNNSLVDIGKLEYCIRTDLEARTRRAMCVLRPLSVELTDLEPGEVLELEAPWWPGAPEKGGTRPLRLGDKLFIELEDFAERPPKHWHRLAPGAEVRLRHGPVIRCDEMVRDEDGALLSLRCSRVAMDTGSRTAEGRRVKGTLHWVSALDAVQAEVRLYDRLFSVEMPQADPDVDYRTLLNPNSLTVLSDSLVEPAAAAMEAGTSMQFERQGYFVTDQVDHSPDRPVFNRTITLRDTWAKARGDKGAGRSISRNRRPKRKSKASTNTEPLDKRKRADLRRERREADPWLQERSVHYASLGLRREEQDLLSGERSLAHFYDDAVAAQPHPKAIARWLINELLGRLPNDDPAALPFAAPAFARLVALVEDGTISATAGKQVLSILLKKGGEPEAIVADQNLSAMGAGDELRAIVDKVLEAHADELHRYRDGEHKLLGFFIGQVMRQSRGKAEASAVRQTLIEALR